MPSEESMIDDLREIEEELRNKEEYRKANIINLFIKHSTYCKISKEKIKTIIEQKRDYIDKELQKANSSNNEEVKERLWCASAMLEELEQELFKEEQ